MEIYEHVECREKGKEELSSISAYCITESLSNSYNSEAEFDEKLFKSLKEDLKKYGVEAVNTGNPNHIVLSSSISTCGKHAFGFARQAKGTSLSKRKRDDNIDPGTSFVKDDRNSITRSEFDHICCVFEKRNDDNWTVVGCFSVVELKMSDTSSKSSKNLVVDDPIIQEIDYVLESVWPSICLFRLAKNLKELPIAMIVAQRNG